MFSHLADRYLKDPHTFHLILSQYTGIFTFPCYVHSFVTEMDGKQRLIKFPFIHRMSRTAVYFTDSVSISGGSFQFNSIACSV